MSKAKEKAVAQELVSLGFRQISRKYRRLVCVPPIPEGKNPLEALREIRPDLHRVIIERARKMAENEYFNPFWHGGGSTVELDPATFHEFLLLTGRQPGPLNEYDNDGNVIGPYRRAGWR